MVNKDIEIGALNNFEKILAEPEAKNDRKKLIFLRKNQSLKKLKFNSIGNRYKEYFIPKGSKVRN